MGNLAISRSSTHKEYNRLVNYLSLPTKNIRYFRYYDANWQLMTALNDTVRINQQNYAKLFMPEVEVIPLGFLGTHVMCTRTCISGNVQVSKFEI